MWPLIQYDWRLYKRQWKVLPFPECLPNARHYHPYNPTRQELLASFDLEVIFRKVKLFVQDHPASKVAEPGLNPYSSMPVSPRRHPGPVSLTFKPPVGLPTGPEGELTCLINWSGIPGFCHLLVR